MRTAHTSPGPTPTPHARPGPTSADLYWLPLGAGGHCVTWNGRAYEAISALRRHRRPRALYHSALELRLDGDRFVIEMAPVWSLPIPDRGVVCEGPVGFPVLGRWPAFRYEVRCWRDGVIPDVAFAVDSPRHLTDDRAVVTTMLDRVSLVPAYPWGRDVLGAGDMWNSNSLVAWLLAASGVDLQGIVPPGGGRAPGWDTGLLLAGRRVDEPATMTAR